MQINDFIEEVKKMRVIIDDEKLKQLEIYYNFLIEYNSHTNLTTITKKEDVYLKHFYDSLTIIKKIDLDKVNNLIDIGSGAGFPGVVLKIFYPKLDVTIIDSNNKKTTFINNLIQKLKLKRITVINARAEEYAIKHLNEFDLCVSRAVAFVDIISELSIPFIKETGKVVLMKGNLAKELPILKAHYRELNIKSYEVYNFSLPKSLDERNLVIIEKLKTTSRIMNYSQIIKRNRKWNV